MHPLRPPEHSQQPNQWHTKQYVQSLHLLENPEAVDMENAQGTINMTSLKINSLVLACSSKRNALWHVIETGFT